MGGIRVREPGANDWRKTVSWPQKLLAGFLQDKDLLQLVIYPFSKCFYKYWQPKYDAVKFSPRRSSVQWGD